VVLVRRLVAAHRLGVDVGDLEVLGNQLVDRRSSLRIALLVDLIQEACSGLLRLTRMATGTTPPQANDLLTFSLRVLYVTGRPIDHGPRHVDRGRHPWPPPRRPSEQKASQPERRCRTQKAPLVEHGLQGRPQSRPATISRPNSLIATANTPSLRASERPVRSSGGAITRARRRRLRGLVRRRRRPRRGHSCARPCGGRRRAVAPRRPQPAHRRPRRANKLPTAGDNPVVRRHHTGLRMQPVK
jgi:hypothetical protein